MQSHCASVERVHWSTLEEYLVYSVLRARFKHGLTTIRALCITPAARRSGAPLEGWGAARARDDTLCVVVPTARVECVREEARAAPIGDADGVMTMSS